MSGSFVHLREMEAHGEPCDPQETDATGQCARARIYRPLLGVSRTDLIHPHRYDNKSKDRVEVVLDRAPFRILGLEKVDDGANDTLDDIAPQ